MRFERWSPRVTSRKTSRGTNRAGALTFATTNLLSQLLSGPSLVSGGRAIGARHVDGSRAAELLLVALGRADESDGLPGAELVIVPQSGHFIAAGVEGQLQAGEELAAGEVAQVIRGAGDPVVIQGRGDPLDPAGPLRD